ncbi:hypothetical protein [Bradyrhizobium sp. USDA 3315]
MITPDQIKATARAAMPPDMAAAETELHEIETAQADLCSKIAADQGIACGTHQAWGRANSLDDRRAAQVRLDGLNAEAARLDRSAAEVRARIREHGGENAIAVRDAMTPLRKAAAQRIVSTIDDLCVAIAALNATGLALRETGTSAVFMPAPLLAGMREIAQSIASAKTPSEEKR